jgi:hypothetical protein
VNEARNITGKYPGCAAINDAMEINKTSSVIYAINLEDV